MKIAIDAHSLERGRTGQGRYLINLLKFWSRLNEFRFVLYFQKEIPQDKILKSDCFIKKILKAPFRIQSNAFWQHFLLPKACLKDKIDILFSPSYLLPFGWRGKSIVTLHDISYEAHPQWFTPANRFLLQKISKVAAKKATAILVPSEFTKREIVKYYCLPQSKIYVTPLAPDEQFKPLRNENKFKEVKKHYKIKNRVILYIGSIFNRRHIPELIEVFEKIAKRFLEYQILIIGANHTYPFIDIQSLIKETNKKLGRTAVLQIDWVPEEDLPWLYNISDLTILLSDYEGFGLSVLEAMACGVPVVTTNLGSIPEVVDNCALFVDDPTDINEIAKVIHQGLTDEGLRNDLAERGLIQAKKFSWGKCARETLDILLNC